jgi:hypothetical protein
VLGVVVIYTYTLHDYVRLQLAWTLAPERGSMPLGTCSASVISAG